MVLTDIVRFMAKDTYFIIREITSIDKLKSYYKKLPHVWYLFVK